MGKQYRHCPDLKIDTATLTSGIDTLIQAVHGVAGTGNQDATDAEVKLIKVCALTYHKFNFPSDVQYTGPSHFMTKAQIYVPWTHLTGTCFIYQKHQ